MDVCIQIGNTDNKLSQQEWSEYCSAIRSLCASLGSVHFAGGPANDMPWQNYCVCVSTDNPDRLRDLVLARREHHKQDSVAWLEGTTSLI